MSSYSSARRVNPMCSGPNMINSNKTSSNNIRMMGNNSANSFGKYYINSPSQSKYSGFNI